MSIRLIHGDCRDVLATLPAESVHCVVTSPPYFGLRDYGTAQWDGGDPACTHMEVQPQGRVGRETPGGRGGSFPVSERAFKSECRKCGAIRIDRQIGLEPTPDAYVATLVDVFRQVRRVLRKDGTVFLNLGDSYSGGGGFSPDAPSNRSGSKQTTQGSRDYKGRTPTPGLKPKDLIGIPWRVAFALQADGWYLRSDIIWAKPNPMPESVTDRPTKAHEYLFLLAKSERYYYDADAIREEVSELSKSVHGSGYIDGGSRHKLIDSGLGHSTGSLRSNGANRDIDAGRNRRSVWTVATAPFAEAHFATFPPALIEPCILAGCPPGGTVLDPFGGAGTTGLVADRLQRNAVLIELNPKYSDMAERRIVDDGPLFADVAAIQLRLEATPDAVRKTLGGPP